MIKEFIFATYDASSNLIDQIVFESRFANNSNIESDYSGLLQLEEELRFLILKLMQLDTKLPRANQGIRNSISIV
jgi:hypothetical protein